MTAPAQLRARIADLERQLTSARSALAAVEADAATPRVTATPDPAEKIALFMERLVDRNDVYAHRWVGKRTGKPGWSPAVRGGFYTDAATDFSDSHVPMLERMQGRRARVMRKERFVRG